MDKKETASNKVIDEYYKEQISAKTESDYEFKAKMDRSLTYMDSLERLDFPIDINILQIIAEGEQIKDKKKFRLELFAFIALCTFIISAVTVIIGITSPKVFLYFQLLISSIMPFLIIPAAKISAKKGEA
jgi:hypothetical protein